MNMNNPFSFLMQPRPQMTMDTSATPASSQSTAHSQFAGMQSLLTRNSGGSAVSVPTSSNPPMQNLGNSADYLAPLYRQFQLSQPASTAVSASMPITSPSNQVNSSNGVVSAAGDATANSNSMNMMSQIFQQFRGPTPPNTAMTPSNAGSSTSTFNNQAVPSGFPGQFPPATPTQQDGGMNMQMMMAQMMGMPLMAAMFQNMFASQMAPVNPMAAFFQQMMQPSVPAFPSMPMAGGFPLPSMDSGMAKQMLVQLIQQLQHSGQLPNDDSVQRLCQNLNPTATSGTDEPSANSIPATAVVKSELNDVESSDSVARNSKKSKKKSKRSSHYEEEEPSISQKKSKSAGKSSKDIHSDDIAADRPMDSSSSRRSGKTHQPTESRADKSAFPTSTLKDVKKNSEKLFNSSTDDDNVNDFGNLGDTDIEGDDSPPRKTNRSKTKSKDSSDKSNPKIWQAHHGTKEATKPSSQKDDRRVSLKRYSIDSSNIISSSPRLRSKGDEKDHNMDEVMGNKKLDSSSKSKHTDSKKDNQVEVRSLSAKRKHHSQDTSEDSDAIESRTKGKEDAKLKKMSKKYKEDSSNENDTISKSSKKSKDEVKTIHKKKSKAKEESSSDSDDSDDSSKFDKKAKGKPERHEWPMRTKPVSFKPVTPQLLKPSGRKSIETAVLENSESKRNKKEIEQKKVEAPSSLSKCFVQVERINMSQVSAETKNIAQPKKDIAQPKKDIAQPKKDIAQPKKDIVVETKEVADNVKKGAGRPRAKTAAEIPSPPKMAAPTKSVASTKSAPGKSATPKSVLAKPGPKCAKKKSSAQNVDESSHDVNLGGSLEPLRVEVSMCMNEFRDSQLRIMYMGRPDENMEWLAVVSVVKDSKNFCQCCFCPFLGSSPKEIADHMVGEHGELNFALNKMRQPSGPLLLIHCRHCDFVSADPTIMFIHFEVHHGLLGIIDNASSVDVDLQTPVNLRKFNLDEVVSILTSYVCFDCSLISDDVHKVSLHILQEHPETMNYNGCFVKLLMIQKSDGFESVTYRQVINNLDHANSRREMFHCMICGYVGFCPFLSLSHNLMTHQTKKLVYICSIKNCSFRCLEDEFMLNHLTDKHNLAMKKSFRLICSATLVDKIDPSELYKECEVVINRKTSVETIRPARKSSARPLALTPDQSSSDEDFVESKTKAKKAVAKKATGPRKKIAAASVVILDDDDVKEKENLLQYTTISSSAGALLKQEKASEQTDELVVEQTDELVVETNKDEEIVLEVDTDSTDVEMISQRDSTYSVEASAEDASSMQESIAEHGQPIQSWVFTDTGVLEKASDALISDTIQISEPLPELDQTQIEEKKLNAKLESEVSDVINLDDDYTLPEVDDKTQPELQDGALPVVHDDTLHDVQQSDPVSCNEAANEMDELQLTCEDDEGCVSLTETVNKNYQCPESKNMVEDGGNTLVPADFNVCSPKANGCEFEPKLDEPQSPPMKGQIISSEIQIDASESCKSDGDTNYSANVDNVNDELLCISHSTNDIPGQQMTQSNDTLSLPGGDVPISS